MSGGSTIIGPGYDTLAFLLGILIAVVGIWFLGIIARSAAQKSIERAIDRIFTKLPIIRTIYNPVSRVVRLTTDKNAGDFSGMAVVSCRFGGTNGVDILALLANQETYYIGGEPRKMVYLPTAPIPMSGGLVLVPQNAIVPVPEMKVDDLLRIYFSLGALAPDSMPKRLKIDPATSAADVPLLEPSGPKRLMPQEAAERVFQTAAIGSSPGEKLLDVREPQFDEGWAAVIALAGVWRCLHFTQQRVHFLGFENASPSHAAVAGDAGANLV